jgi:hypothetical protein
MHFGTEPRKIRWILQRATTQGRPYRLNQFFQLLRGAGRMFFNTSALQVLETSSNLKLSANLIRFSARALTGAVLIFSHASSAPELAPYQFIFGTISRSPFCATNRLKS